MQAFPDEFKARFGFTAFILRISNCSDCLWKYGWCWQCSALSLATQVWDEFRAGFTQCEPRVMLASRCRSNLIPCLPGFESLCSSFHLPIFAYSIYIFFFAVAWFVSFVSWLCWSAAWGMIGFNESAACLAMGFSILLSQSSGIQEVNFNCLDNQFGCMIHAANLQQLTYCVLPWGTCSTCPAKRFSSFSMLLQRYSSSAVHQRMKLFESIW